MWVVKRSVTVGILKVLSLKHRIINQRIKFVCIVMCSLMMSVCSCDVITLNGSRLTGLTYSTVPAWILDGRTPTC